LRGVIFDIVLMAILLVAIIFGSIFATVIALLIIVLLVGLSVWTIVKDALGHELKHEVKMSKEQYSKETKVIYITGLVLCIVSLWLSNWLIFGLAIYYAVKLSVRDKVILRH